LVSHPFDLAKVRLQTTQGASKQGMIGTMINVARNEGLLALYTGLSASLLRQGTYSTVRFGTYDLLKEKFGPKDGSKFPCFFFVVVFFLPQPDRSWGQKRLDSVCQ